MPQAVGIIVSVAVGVGQFIQGRKAAKAQREAGRIADANEKNRNLSERRKAARQERVRRASLFASSENTGATGSSLSGALAGLSQSLNMGIAEQESNAVAAQGISRQNDIIAKAQTTSSALSAFGSIVSDISDYSAERKKIKSLEPYS